MKKQIFKNKRFILYLWLAAIFLSLWFIGDLVNEAHRSTFFQRAVNHIWRTSWILPLNFILFEYTLKKLRSRGIFTSVLFILAHLLLYSWGLYFWREIGLAIHVYTSYATHNTIYAAAEEQFTFSMMSLVFFGFSRHFYDHYQLTQAAQRLQIEKQQAELNFLKSQTNPHFLFNTLNNIYSLARKKSDQTPEAVMRLSEILRFMLYETSGKYVTVDKEIEVITNYIELEKLRYDKSLQITFQHIVEDRQQLVPPLLLMPLVENAFKHGASETIAKPYVNIQLSVSNGKLLLVVRNSTGESIVNREIKENIGLSNLRRQLQILYQQYELSLENEPDAFLAKLKIDLATHV